MHSTTKKTTALRLYTIGFTKKSAQEFFELLKNSGAKRIVDVRLNNSSQLAGFAKRDDLEYFLKEISDMDYLHLPDLLAPNKEMLNEYRKSDKTDEDWDRYEQRFLNLMRERQIENTVPRDIIEDACLLCSEHEPHHCHRSLIVDYLQEHQGDIKVLHLT